MDISYEQGPFHAILAKFSPSEFIARLVDNRGGTL